VKRIFGLILFGLGVCLVLLAPLFRFYVGPSSAVTPLNQFTESTGVGVVQKQLVISKFLAGDPNPYNENFPVKQTRYTRGDVLAAEQDPAKSDNLAVFDTFQRLNNTANGELVNASSSRYAFGRTDSLLANCCNANAGGKTVQFSGVMPLKFPFFTKQETYDVWDDTLLGTTPFEFVVAEDHAGVATFKFQSNIPPTKVPGSELKVPAKILGQPGSGDATISQYYTGSTTTWIEPETGQIVDSNSSPIVSFRGADGQKDLAVALALKAGGDPAFVESSAKDINSKADLLKLVMNTLPIIFLILGLIFIAVGLLLSRNSDNSSGPSAPATGPPATV